MEVREGLVTLGAHSGVILAALDVSVFRDGSEAQASSPGAEGGPAGTLGAKLGCLRSAAGHGCLRAGAEAFGLLPTWGGEGGARPGILSLSARPSRPQLFLPPKSQACFYGQSWVWGALCIKSGESRAPGWLSGLSVRLSISAQVMIPRSWD